MIFITLAILPWVGGKQALFKTIIKRFPSDYRRRTYVEVFGGGGTMLLNKDRSVKEIFNDANGNLINLYRVVRQQPEELMRRLTYVLNSKADFILTKEQIKLGQYHDPVQWAADYYQVIKQSYAGKGSTFGANPRSMWAAFPLIDAVCARLQYVVIENADFGKIIPANDSPNTIFYLDPPYYFTEDYYPGQIFTQADHYRLFETIMSIKGLWLLSYNFCPETVDLYSKPGLYIEKLERPNNMAQKYDPGSMYEEILVSNFDTSKPLPLQMSLSGDIPEERNFIENVLGYVRGLKTALEQDNLVAMRLQERADFYLDSFKDCADKVRQALEDEVPNLFELAAEEENEMPDMGMTM